MLCSPISDNPPTESANILQQPLQRQWVLACKRVVDPVERTHQGTHSGIHCRKKGWGVHFSPGAFAHIRTDRLPVALVVVEDVVLDAGRDVV